MFVSAWTSRARQTQKVGTMRVEKMTVADGFFEQRQEEIDTVARIIGSHYGFKTNELLAPEVVIRNIARHHARQMALYLAARLVWYPRVGLGRRFNMDHTRVLHSLRKVEARAKTDADFGAVLGAWEVIIHEAFDRLAHRA
jgi:chromosomal replication initiation ATPase DnaA